MLPTFLHPDLLKTALTHRSALNETGIEESNERLEFLGDAVLELAVSRFLYESQPQADEGVLTSLRSALVKTQTLAKISSELGLGELLHVSRGEERSGGRENQSLLADTFEAFLGALYLDQGYDACETFLATHLFSLLPEIQENKLYRDHKTTLQEYIQGLGKPAPRYQTTNEVGPDHDKTFTVDVLVDHDVLGTGTGKSKQEAQQDAARSALEKIETN